MSAGRDRGPSFETLDRNLAALFTRAYVPVLPRAAFRAELLELARDEAQANRSRGGSRARRLLLVALPLAAAAALLVWFAASRLLGTDSALDGRGGAGNAPLIVDTEPSTPREGLPRPRERDGVEMRSPDSQVADEERRGVGPGDETAGGTPPPTSDADTPAPPAEGTAAVAGTVTGPDGEPVPRFRVILLPDREVPDVAEPRMREFEAADGAFRWDGIAADRYELFVEADGLAQHRRGPFELASGSASELAVELVRGRRLRGWVVAATTEAPLPGATVVVESETPSKALPFDLDPVPAWLTRIARTGSDGAFAFGELSAGAQRLRVDAPGFAPAWVMVDVPPVAAGAETSALVDVPQVIVRLGAGGGVHGAVTDESGQPIAGSVVLATFADDPAVARLFSYEEARTDARGEYAFEHLAPGLYMMIQWNTEAEFHGGGAPTLRPALVTLGGSVAADFRGELEAARIAGALFDAAGVPLPNMKLTLMPEVANTPEGTEAWSAGSSDAEARFSFPIESTGTYLLYATFGMGERLTLIHRFEVPEGENEHLEDVHVPATSAVVEIVRAVDGTPVPNASVAALAIAPDGTPSFAGRAMADEQGRAELTGLLPGRYRFFGQAIGADDLGQAATAPIELRADPEAGTSRVRLELPLGGALRVTVTDAAGAPIRDVRVAVSLIGGPTITSFVEPLTDPAGRLAVTGLAPGRYTARVTHDGFAPQAVEVEVRAVVGADIQITLSIQD